MTTKKVNGKTAFRGIELKLVQCVSNLIFANTLNVVPGTKPSRGKMQGPNNIKFLPSKTKITLVPDLTALLGPLSESTIKRPLQLLSPVFSFDHVLPSQPYKSL